MKDLQLKIKKLHEECIKLDEERMWLLEENKKYEIRLKSEEKFYSEMYNVIFDRNLKTYERDKKVYEIISKRCDVFNENKPNKPIFIIDQ